MNLRKILDEERRNIEPDKKIVAYIEEETKFIVSLLEGEIKRRKLNAEVFVGGSFAKGTLIKREEYDIDIFVRFDWKLSSISDILEQIVNEIKKQAGMKLERVHGSRDYFRFLGKGAIFEIIPIYKIKTPKEARNVTDLSYFHVNYVKRKVKKLALGKEIMLAKKFCQAQGVYGAESYIQGFSGYGLECLTLNYKKFEKMLKELVKARDRIILDPEKKFKRKADILFELNENKLQSPIILIDPTWKERNVLAALSKDAFHKFQDSALRFLKNPSKEFFKINEINENKLREFAEHNKAEFLHMKIKTNRQEGDIAGTKMKKFARFLNNELKIYFNILSSDFSYSRGQEAEFYLVVKPKKEAIKFGPPKNMKENASAFREKNKNVFEKNGMLYARIKVNFSAREFLDNWKRKNADKMQGMGIVELKFM